jgi:hypothetical protein
VIADVELSAHALSTLSRYGSMLTLTREHVCARIGQRSAPAVDILAALARIKVRFGITQRGRDDISKRHGINEHEPAPSRWRLGSSSGGARIGRSTW